MTATPGIMLILAARFPNDKNLMPKASSQMPVIFADNCKEPVPPMPTVPEKKVLKNYQFLNRIEKCVVIDCQISSFISNLRTHTCISCLFLSYRIYCLLLTRIYCHFGDGSFWPTSLY